VEITSGAHQWKTGGSILERYQFRSQTMLRALLIKKSAEVQLLDPDSVRAWQPAQGLLWLHFDVNEEATEQWLLADEHLPQVVTSALLADKSRPRALAIGDGVLLTLRSVNLNPGADPEDMVSIRLWVEADRIISTQRQQLQSVGAVVDSLDEHPLTGSGDMVVRLVDRMMHRLSDVIEKLDDQISKLETEVTQQSPELNRTCLANIRREVIALRRYAAPQHEALRQLYSENFSWLTDADKLTLHEVGDRLLHCLETLEAFRERASVLNVRIVNCRSDVSAVGISDRTAWHQPRRYSRRREPFWFPGILAADVRDPGAPVVVFHQETLVLNIE
jgi:zinc transporter